MATKPPTKKGAQDIAALKARLGVKAAPGAVPAGAGAAVPGSAGGLAPRGAGGPVATVLPPGMGPAAVAEEEDRPPPWAVDLASALDPDAVKTGGVGGIGVKIAAVILPAVFFVFAGHWCGENNYARENHNARIDEAEGLTTRFGTTLDEIQKVHKAFEKYFTAMKAKEGKDFSEMSNFASYLAGLRIETFVDEASITSHTPFMDPGLVTRMLVYYSDVNSFVALSNHHGHLVTEHVDELKKAHDTAQSFKDALYVVKVPKGPKGAPAMDGVTPSALGTAEIIWVDPANKDKGIKGWRVTVPGSTKVEEMEKNWAAPVMDDSKKAILQPKDLNMLYEYNGRMSDMVKLLSKLTEEGRKILLGKENTLEAEKSGVKLLAF